MRTLFSTGTEIEEFLFAHPMSRTTWITAVAVMIVVVILLYLRERGPTGRMRVALALARIVILLVVATAILGPTAVIRETRDEKRALAVLIDTSQSMSVRDQRKRPEDIRDAAAALGFLDADSPEPAAGMAPALDTRQRDAIGSATRLDLATTLLSESAAPLFASLRDDLDIRYFAFDRSLRMLGDDAPSESGAMKGITPRGRETSLAGAIKEAADTYRDGSLAGIIVLTDGIDTGKRRPESVAHDLGLRDIPLLVLPTGIPDPDDVSVRNVVVQDVAFAGDTVPVRVQIRSKGYEKRGTELVVRFADREVARQSLVLEGGLQFVDLFFDANIGTKGAAVLAVEVEAFADEATAENNTVARSVRVVNEKINVLCIEGSARWEFRYLRAILKRDPRINATFIATRTGNELALNSSDYLARFPEDAEDAFKYDLVILGDVDASFFTPGELTRLEELIRERGGSLLMLAGPKYSPGSYAGTSVERMLPVRFDPDGKWLDVDKTIHPVITTEGRGSSVLTLENNRDKNDRIWSRMSPMDRLPPLLAPRPGATVLAELSDSGTRTSPYPLISWQRYGTGKCMLMASDRLWRLRLRTGDKYHWRVWSQCIQFLTLSRLMGEHKQIRMETDRASYPAGDQVRIYAEVLDDGYEPVLQERYDVQVGLVGDDEEEAVKERVSLRPDATRPGLYVGYHSPAAVGRYRIEGDEEDIGRANTIEFQVADTSPEMADTDMRLGLLQELADLSGGRSFRYSEVGDLAAALDTSPRQVVIRRDLSLWDHWIVAALVIGLAGFEWIARRKHDLL